MEAATCCTVIDTESLAEPEVAVIDAVPVPMAVTRPVSSTDATCPSEEFQASEAPSITLPPESRTLAESVVVSPREARDSVVPETETETGACVTATAAAAAAEPEVAVIVAGPIATAVTRPAVDTLAI